MAESYSNGDWSNVDRQPSQLPARANERAAPRRQPAGDRSTSPRTGADPSTVDQLNRDSAARREGSQRTGDYGNYRSGSGSGTRDTGSYRSGSGSSGWSASGASRGARRAAAAADAVAAEEDGRQEANIMDVHRWMRHSICAWASLFAAARRRRTHRGRCADEIADEQAKKAEDLRPYVAGAAERWTETITREFLEEPGGFYPFFGSVCIQRRRVHTRRRVPAVLRRPVALGPQGARIRSRATS